VIKNGKRYNMVVILNPINSAVSHSQKAFFAKNDPDPATTEASVGDSLSDISLRNCGLFDGGCWALADQLQVMLMVWVTIFLILILTLSKIVY
jgi:hypothetical protein